MTLKVLDLFAGIGGFSRGLESTGGFETVGFCEQDKFCQKILAKNYPNINIYDDVRSINGRTMQADVVTGGFPCQGFSQAGKQKGTSDERYLWPEMLRVISEVKPRWVIGENVQGIINIEDGMVLRQVHNDLESFRQRCVASKKPSLDYCTLRQQPGIKALPVCTRETRAVGEIIQK